MVTTGIGTPIEKLNAVLNEMGARCYCESTPISHGCIMSIKHYYTPQSRFVIEVHDDGGFEVFAPVEKTNSVDATIAALKAL